MRWQKPLRYAIGIAGLGIAAFIYVRYEKKPTTATAPRPPAMLKDATFQSEAGEQVRYGKDSKEVSRIKHEGWVRFADGHQMLTNPSFRGDREGKPYVVSANQGDLRAPNAGDDPNKIPEETHLIGNVVMHEDAGMEIKTEDALYRESLGILEIPGPMTFNDGKTSGSGVGATYDRNQQLLTLKDQAVIRMSGDTSGAGKFDATAKSMFINRTTHLVSMDGGSRIARDHEVLSAESAQMHMDDDNHGVQLMELRQHASVVPVSGQGNTPEMHGDDINLEFQPDGRTIKRTQLMRSASMVMAGDTGAKKISSDTLDVQLGKDGQTVTNLNGQGGVVMMLPATNDLPRRDITSKTMNASGSEKDGLTSARFDQAVKFVENRPATRGQQASTRTVWANQLTLTLAAGDFSEIKDARFVGKVAFQDSGAKSGEADEMRYLVDQGTLKLSQAPTSVVKPFVQTDRIRVDAKTIDITLDKVSIKASGELVTHTVPDKTKGARGLFDDSKETTGTAESLDYDADRGIAQYKGKGNVRLFQGKDKDMSQIKNADAISINDNKGDIVATGKLIETIFPISNLQSPGAVTNKATAAKFTYIDADHHAAYTGSGKGADRALLNGPDGKIYGWVIDLWLSDDGSELKKMVVSQEVEARISADQTVRGSRMQQDTKAGVYELTGSAAVMIQRTVDKGGETCTETAAPSLTLKKSQNPKDQGTFAASDTVGAGSRTTNLPNCTSWIIK